MRRHVDRWQIIILVDESGSMLDSVIHSAVTASIFFSLRTMRVHLCLFDTQVVDVTDQCTDPVETLMKVQLGGGTDIGQALSYAADLVDNPRRTIVVLITDFFEGAPLERLYARGQAADRQRRDAAGPGRPRRAGRADLRPRSGRPAGADGGPRRRDDPRRARRVGRRESPQVKMPRPIP